MNPGSLTGNRDSYLILYLFLLFSGIKFIEREPSDLQYFYLEM